MVLWCRLEMKTTNSIHLSLSTWIKTQVKKASDLACCLCYLDTMNWEVFEWTARMWGCRQQFYKYCLLLLYFYCHFFLVNRMKSLHNQLLTVLSIDKQGQGITLKSVCLRGFFSAVGPSTPEELCDHTNSTPRHPLQTERSSEHLGQWMVWCLWIFCHSWK